MTSLTASWQSAKIVRTREKISFFASVMSLLATALMLGSYPQYVHNLYSPSAIMTLLQDISTLHTPSELVPSSPSVLTTTRSVPGIISCSIYATTATSSISSISGFFHPVPLYSSRVTVSHTGLLRARLSHGETVLSSTTWTRSPRCSSTSTRPCLLLLFGMLSDFACHVSY